MSKESQEKMIQAAREKIKNGQQQANSSSGQKSFLGEVIGAFINAIEESGQRPSAGSQVQGSFHSDEHEGKVSGHKPQSQGGIAAVGKKISDQIKNGKR